MAEWALGRHTRRGPLGALARAGLPLGRYVGAFVWPYHWLRFAVPLAILAVAVW